MKKQPLSVWLAVIAALVGVGHMGQYWGDAKDSGTLADSRSTVSPAFQPCLAPLGVTAFFLRADASIIKAPGRQTR